MHPKTGLSGRSGENRLKLAIIGKTYNMLLERAIFGLLRSFYPLNA